MKPSDIRFTGEVKRLTPARKALGMLHDVIENRIELTGPMRDGMRAKTAEVSAALDRLDELEAANNDKRTKTKRPKRSG